MKPETIYKYDVLRDCALLEKNRTFENLYSLICAHGDVKAAEWIEDGEIKSLTFNELKQLADNWAAIIKERIGTEGRVCILLDSSKDWFPLFWGLVRSGHDVMTIDASMSDEKTIWLLDQAACSIVVSPKGRNFPARFTQMTILELSKAPEVSGYEPVWGHNIALCTSGTTADSRIFVYNEDTICYLALFSAKVHDENYLLIDDEPFKTLAFLPFHHILGFAAIFIWSHFLGDTTVYLKDRSAQTIVQTVLKCKVDQIVTVPLLANSLSKGLRAKLAQQSIFKRVAFGAMVNLSLTVQRVAPEAGLKMAAKMFKSIRAQLLGNEIRSLVIGGGSTDPAALRLLNALGYYTICGFGMTETAINSFETSWKLSNRLHGSIGAPMAYTEFRTRDGKNPGELQIRGKGTHDGRFIDGQLLPPDIDEEGWFNSGDIIRINEARGEYLIEGRIKDVIVNESGENVYPDELEFQFSSLQGVEQYTVLGTERKGSKYEDITLAMAVGANFNNSAFISALAANVRSINKNQPVYKRLTRAFVTDGKLPVANGFKVRRQELKKMLSAGRLRIKDLELSSLNAESAPVRKTPEQLRQEEIDSLKFKIRDIYAEILHIKPSDISPDANFVDDLNGDSLQVLSIATRAEECFGVFVPAESYACCTTVNGAAELIYNLIHGTAEGSKLVEHEPVISFEDSKEFKEFQVRYNSLTAEGAYNPYFVVHESPLLDTSIIDGTPYLDFGSYNYVGMSGRKEVSDAAKAAIDKYGTSASGSRLLAGEKPIHRELERAIAKWKHAEDALVCVGGHSTNVTVVGNFCGKNDLILYDALAHNSIEQGARLSEAMARPFPHNDIAALEEILKAQRKYFEKVLIVIEGVYSMDGDISNVPAFVDVKKKYGCFLMVDEAHSACVLGPTGGGVDEYFNLAPEDIDLKYGTLSKGLGTCGGYIAGKKCIVDYLRYNLPGFVFSVGISPALAGASLKAVQLLQENPEIMERLHSNIAFFSSEAERLGLNICGGGKSAILPVLVGRDEDAVALSIELQNRGILVPPAVHPAVPKGKARLRFDVISEHKKEQITHTLETLVQAAKDLRIELPKR